MLLYSLVVTAARPLVMLLADLVPRLKEQVQGRESVAALAKRLAPKRSRYRNGAVFYCSSAGEYEQARPLIERLEATGDTYVQVIFHSKSGLDYVKARNDPVNACLAPIGDSSWEWGWLLAALRPKVTVVVRHELWPGFLDAARQYGKLYLIAASLSLGESGSWVKRRIRTVLLAQFDRIYAVRDADAAFFRRVYGVSDDRLLVAGDPKYDRVLERAAAKRRETEEIKAALERAGAFAHRLVAGSVHKADVEVLLSARARLGDNLDSWQMILVPHHVTAEMIAWILERCTAAGLSAIRYSDLALGGLDGRRSIVVLDAMGMLAETYGTGTLGYVGGALHHQVHNVLEPACRGLALAFGPFYKNSQEAVQLVSQGLAAVVKDAADLAKWWDDLKDGTGARADGVRAEVDRHAGAASRILADWGPALISDRSP